MTQDVAAARVDFPTNDPTNPLHRLADDIITGRIKDAAISADVSYALARVAALEEVEKAARAYFMGWVQDEAADDGPEFTGCSEDQHRAAIALKDALNDSHRGGGA